MSESQDSEETVNNDLSSTNSTEVNHQRIYKNTLENLKNDFIALHDRVSQALRQALTNLTVMLNVSEERDERWNYELLQRTEAMIVEQLIELNKMVGPQTAFNRGVVIMSGVSKKDFNSVTQENIQLKNVFEHIVPTQLKEEVRNVATQEKHANEIAEQKEIEEQKEFEDDPESMKQIIDHQAPGPEENASDKPMTGSLKSYQDDFGRENEERTKHQEMLDISEQENEGIKMENSPWQNPAVEEKFDKLREENKMLLQSCEELKSWIADLKEENTEKLEEVNKKLEEANKKLSSQAAELSTAEIEKSININKKAVEEKEKLVKENAQHKKKCDGLFQQVQSLIAKQKESEEELEKKKQTIDRLAAELNNFAASDFIREALNPNYFHPEEVQNKLDNLVEQQVLSNGTGIDEPDMRPQRCPIVRH